MTATTTLRVRRVIMSQEVYKDIFREQKLENMKQELNFMARKNGWKAWTVHYPKNRIGPFVFEFYNPTYEVPA